MKAPPKSAGGNPVYSSIDTTDLAQAAKLIQSIAGGPRPAVGGIKLGLEFFLAHGAPGVRYAFPMPVRATGVGFFLDLKLHDIPNTVQRAASQVARMGATFLTVHAYPQTMKAAKAGVLGSGLKILAVTVMTSYDDGDLKSAGYAHGVAELVARRAQQAKEAGVDGLILSAEEAAAQRAALGPDMLLVTPGIRPAGADVGDQKRVMTPARAIGLGADHLVVGRPVTQAGDPRAAAEAIVAEIQSAL